MFASWKPFYDDESDQVIDSTYLTDVNGLQIMKRDVEDDEKPWFESQLVPINSVISVKDAAKIRDLTVRNDRPQGGLVWKDGTIKLNIDRRFW